MLKEVAVREYVRSIATGQVYLVLDIDPYYGTFTAKNMTLPTMRIKTFRFPTCGNACFEKLSTEQVADYFLVKANHGLDDSWSED